MLTEWLLLALGVVLTAGTAVFVASEFSLVTLDPAVVRSAAADGGEDWRDRSVRATLQSLSTALSASQVGVTVTTILLGYTAQPALYDLVVAGLGHTGLARGVAVVLAGAVALVVVNFVSMLFGELIPKNFALSLPYPTARLVVPVQSGFTKVARPLVTLLNASANAVLRRFGVEPVEELSGARSSSELVALVRRSAAEGTLEEGVATLLTNSLELEELTAVDVMTDRLRVDVLSRDASAAELLDLVRATGHSRFPVIDRDRDDVVGLVHVRRAVAVPASRRAEVPVGALMVEAPRVPETVRLGPLLVELRGLGLQMAVVVDEYGGTSGVVTLEDVVEELVGEVADEHDPRTSGPRRSADGSWQTSGQTRPDELTEQTGLVVPESGAYETLGGLVMQRLGRMPAVGDQVEVGGVLLRVEEMDGRRVERLSVRAPEPTGEADA